MLVPDVYLSTAGLFCVVVVASFFVVELSFLLDQPLDVSVGWLLPFLWAYNYSSC